MDGVGMTAHNYAYWMNLKHGKSSLVAPNVNDYKDRVDYKVIRFKSVLLPGMNPYRVGLPMIDFKFKKKLAKNNFDILHAHCPFISGQLALKLSRKLDIPLVVTFHTKYRDDFKKALPGEMFVDFLMTLTMGFYNSADVVWVPNRATGETLKEYGFTGEFEIMPNGTDFDIPEKGKYLKYRHKGLEEIKANNDDFILLFVGQHRWEKNVRTILDSLKILKEKKESFKMVFAGEGARKSIYRHWESIVDEVNIKYEDIINQHKSKNATKSILPIHDCKRRLAL